MTEEESYEVFKKQRLEEIRIWKTVSLLVNAVRISNTKDERHCLRENILELIEPRFDQHRTVLRSLRSRRLYMKRNIESEGRRPDKVSEDRQLLPLIEQAIEELEDIE